MWITVGKLVAVGTSSLKQLPPPKSETPCKASDHQLWLANLFFLPTPRVLCPIWLTSYERVVRICKVRHIQIQKCKPFRVTNVSKFVVWRRSRFTFFSSKTNSKLKIKTIERVFYFNLCLKFISSMSVSFLFYF